jgi:RNA polymerase sigma factor (sigma-70 family)
VSSVSTDGEIIRRSLEDPAAFSEIFDRHAVTIHRYAARRVSEAADDVMSETFLIAFEKRFSFNDPREDARPWLYGISTVLLRRHRRREATAWRGLIADASASQTPVSDGTDDRIDASLAVRKLAATIGRMKPGDRDALLLYAWGDLDYEGVAQAIGIPVGTVRSRLNRARLQLRHSIGQDQLAKEVEHGRDHTAPRGA